MILKFSNFLNSLYEGINVESDFIYDKIMSIKNQILNLSYKNNSIGIINLLNTEFKNQFKFDTKSKLDIDRNIKELEIEIEYRKQRVEKLQKFQTLKQGASLELKRTTEVLRAFKQKKNRNIKIVFTTWKIYHRFDKLSFIQKIGLWFYKRSFGELTFGQYYESKWMATVKQYKFGIIFGEYDFVDNVLTVVFNDDFSKNISKQSDDFDKFAYLVTDILHHELTHKADMLNMGIREMKSKRNVNGMLEYLSDERELEAHAGDAYKQLKRQFSDADIKAMLNDPFTVKNRTKLETSIAANKYLMIIYESPNTYLLFVDKLMDNMEKYYRSEEIL